MPSLNEMPDKEEGFKTDLPTVPEGEFAVFGTVELPYPTQQECLIITGHG